MSWYHDYRKDFGMSERRAHEFAESLVEKGYEDVCIKSWRDCFNQKQYTVEWNEAEAE